MTAQLRASENHQLPRNHGLPAGISMLRALAMQAKPSTLNLGLGKPEEDMPGEIRALAETSLLAHRMDYTENAGDLGIRAKLAKQISVTDGKKLVLTHGAQEALMASLIALLNRNDEVLIPDPGFLAYAPMIKILGAKPVAYRLKKTSVGFAHDLRSMTAKINSRTRAILLSSPGNPTGCDLHEELVIELCKIIGRKKIVILSDEVYGMLHFTKPYLPLARLDDRVISISSFSKSHALTGWRIGYLACENSALLQSTLIAHQYLATCASVPAQHLLGELLSTRHFLEIPHHYREVYHAKLKLFANSSSEALRAKIPKACGGFYLFPELPEKENSLQFCERMLKEEDLLVIPGSAFGKFGEGSVRLSLALPDDQIKKAAIILSKAYASE